MLLLRKCLVGSLIFHVLIVLGTSLIALRTQNIKQMFIVLGAHSSKPTAVSYKSFKMAVPFVTEERKKGAISKLQATQKKTVQKKVLNIKKQIIPKAPVLKDPKITKKPQLKELATSSNQKEAKKITVSKKKQSEDKKQPNKAQQPSSLKKIKEKELSKKEKQESPQKLVTPQEMVAIQLIKEEKSVQKQIEQIKPLKPRPQAMIIQEEMIMPDDTSPDPQGIGHDSQDPEGGAIVIGDNTGEQVTEYQTTINQEASRVWRPPVGVPQGTTCFVTFIIAQDGTHESHLSQSSPIIIYDLSVMRAARAMKFPKSLWGKQFKIAFRQ